MNSALALKEMASQGRTPSPLDLTAAAQTMASAYEQARRALGAAESALRAARDNRRDAQTAFDRAARGLKRVRPSVLALQRLLADSGIQAVPVADLVAATDDSWQPALEAYLASHVDALLVAGGREQELAAIELYKGLREEHRVYRVKLALPSRGRAWQAPGGGRYAAQLIEGDRDSVWYLRGVLGSLALAHTSEDLHRLSKAISREGMVSSGGAVERLEVPKAGELSLGRGDAESLQEQAERALRETEAAYVTADRTTRDLQGALPRLALYADPDSAQNRWDRLFISRREAERLVNEVRDRLAAVHSDELGRLEQMLSDATERRDHARTREKSLGAEAARLQEQLALANRSSAALQQQVALAHQHEAASRQHPLYNANEVDRHRRRYDERFEDDVAARRKACAERISRAERAADAADHEAWMGFCQYAADYTLQNHDLTKAQWQRVYQYVLADKHRMESLELAEREAETEEAYTAAVRVFRTDVAQVLLEGFEAIDEQINGLNQILKAAPEFSNGERYQFKYKPVEQHRALYDFLRRVREQGEDDVDIFGGSGQVPDEFRALVESDAESALLHEASPLNDHRRFFAYDVEIFHEGKSMGWLSKRFGPGSGGEHRTPLYVIFGAALAAAYGKSRTTTTTGGIIMLDEAFEKMDAQNVRATAQYLNALGLQMIMAGPEADQPKMSSFLNVYYDMARFGSKNVQMTKNIVEDEARELLQSDNFLLHPDLLDIEMAAIAGSIDAPGQ